MHPELSKRLLLQQLEEALAAEGLFGEQVQLEEVSYPTLFIRFQNRRADFRLLRFEATDYDFQPLEIDPVDPITREPLPEDRWMRRHGGGFPGHPMKGHRQFLCLQGTRDYYTHDGHRPQVTGDRWERWRPELRLVDLIRVIRDKFATGEWE